MSELTKEKARLLRRAKEEGALLNCAAKQVADSIYKLNIIHGQLDGIESKEGKCEN